VTLYISNAVLRVPVSTAWFRALRPVVFRAARMLVVAAMSPGVTLQTLLHTEFPLSAIQSIPLESEGFALSTPECQGYHVSNTIAVLECSCDDLLDFLGGERLDFFLFNPWCFGEHHGVVHDVTASPCLAERCPCGPVCLMCRTRA
jgi:hypothetical protein